MAKFIVKVKEVHSAEIVVEADSKSEALGIAEDQLMNDEVETSYDYTLDSVDWTCDKVE